MRKLKKCIILLRVWLVHKMGYTLPVLREAETVSPGKLYDHFAWIVRAVPCKPRDGKIEVGDNILVYDNCLKCDFYEKGIPCNFNHETANGGDICEGHVFEVVMPNPYDI